jgi:hypothetical protein
MKDGAPRKRRKSQTSAAMLTAESVSIPRRHPEHVHADTLFRAGPSKSPGTPETDRRDTVSRTMRKLAVIGLVLLILLFVIPLGIGMAMGHCPDCTPGAGSPLMACVVLLVSASLGVALGVTRIRAAEDRVLGLLLTRRLERPPQFA